VRFGGEPARFETTDGARVLGVADVDAPVAFEREHQVFPAPRKAFLERWITAPGSQACAVGDDDRIDGDGVTTFERGDLRPEGTTYSGANPRR
jgi:hypothetical protein